MKVREFPAYAAMRKVVRRSNSTRTDSSSKRPKIGEWIIPKKTAAAKQPSPAVPLPTGNKFNSLPLVNLGGGGTTKKIPPIIMPATTHQSIVSLIKGIGVLDFNLKYTGNQNVAIFAKSREDRLNNQFFNHLKLLLI